MRTAVQGIKAGLSFFFLLSAVFIMQFFWTAFLVVIAEYRIGFECSDTVFYAIIGFAGTLFFPALSSGILILLYADCLRRDRLAAKVTLIATLPLFIAVQYLCLYLMLFLPWGPQLMERLFLGLHRGLF